MKRSALRLVCKARSARHLRNHAGSLLSSGFLCLITTMMAFLTPSTFAHVLRARFAPSDREDIQPWGVPTTPFDNPTPTSTLTRPTTATLPDTGLYWERVQGSPDGVQTLAFVGSNLYAGTISNGVYVYNGVWWSGANSGLTTLPLWVGNFFVTPAGTLLASMRIAGSSSSSVYRYSGGTWQLIPNTDAVFARLFRVR